MVSVALLMAGSGQRCNLNYNKIMHPINEVPLFAYSLETFLSVEEIDDIVLVVNKDDYDEVQKYIERKKYCNVSIVLGGTSRMESSMIGVSKAKNQKVLVHDAARPLITKEDIETIINKIKNDKIVVASKKVTDTIKKFEGDIIVGTINRDELISAQTPQAVDKNIYMECYRIVQNNNVNVTDEAMLFELGGYEVHYCILKNENIKVTTSNDLDYVKYRLGNMEYRIGHSNDIHQLIPNRKLILGGIEIDYERGLLGHSDADCLLHAITEAIIGALGLGDIGMHFPDTNMKYKDMDSKYFLLEAKKLMDDAGYTLNNLDAIIYLEEPNLKKYKPLMKKEIARILDVDESRVNIKATRKEQMGPIGEKKAIEAECVCLLRSK